MLWATQVYLVFVDAGCVTLASVASRGIQEPPNTTLTTHHHPSPPTTTTYHHHYHHK